jgi:hypothetical protein
MLRLNQGLSALTSFLFPEFSPVGNTGKKRACDFYNGSDEPLKFARLLGKILKSPYLDYRSLQVTST